MVNFQANGGEQYLVFMEKLLEAGKRERVLYIQQTREPYGFVAGMGQSYVEYNRQVARETGILPFFSTTFITTSHICYYDTNHQIVESEVAHLDKLLNRLHPNPYSSYWINRGSPLSITSYFPVELENEKRTNHLIIRLESDIWFSKVMGLLEEYPADRDDMAMYDNRELAACHTPRLNRFIESIRAAALSMDAEWNLVMDDYCWRYQPMLTETGIKLDI
jgi:hypothetical protein